MKTKVLLLCLICISYMATSAERMLNLSDGTSSSVMEEPTATSMDRDVYSGIIYVY